MKVAVVVVLVVLVAVMGVFAWKSHHAAAQTAAGVGLKPGAKETLYLAVPQGLFLPVSKVIDKYQAMHPGIEFPLLVDTPEAMAQAVQENKDKPDIFISPGGHELEVLRQKGFIDPKTSVAFGSYDLAILVPKSNPGKVKRLEDLLNPEVKVISISDPDLNAACYAARQSLQNMGLWEKLKPKMKVTGCCMSSFKWILDGRAEANVQFLGCPLDPKTAETAEKQKVAFACGFPKDTFYIPRNVAGIVTTTKKRKLAEDFLAYLTSPETIKFMADNRMRNDRNLPNAPGPWGPEQELSPKGSGRAAK
ncbi:MAG: substrate-binding domain-containing protein [Armatimonadota bacterium]|jgi:molybdate transport system substrate-binding protein